MVETEYVLEKIIKLIKSKQLYLSDKNVIGCDKVETQAYAGDSYHVG